MLRWGLSCKDENKEAVVYIYQSGERLHRFNENNSVFQATLLDNSHHFWMHELTSHRWLLWHQCENNSSNICRIYKSHHISCLSILCLTIILHTANPLQLTNLHRPFPFLIPSQNFGNIFAFAKSQQEYFSVIPKDATDTDEKARKNWTILERKVGLTALSLLKETGPGYNYT